MSMPVWPGWNPWLTPVFGGATAIGQVSLGIFLLVTVMVVVPVDAAATGDWISMGAIVEISGGTGEPVPASTGTGTGSLALAAVSDGTKPGSFVPGFSG